jgi:CubicO group peptidase (beta-lactamase class C family)
MAEHRVVQAPLVMCGGQLEEGRRPAGKLVQGDPLHVAQPVTWHTGKTARRVWSGARGTTGVAGGAPVTATTQYRIGSISKTFVAVTVLRLRDGGVLDLGDAIGEHLAELDQLPIAIAQLLSHTAPSHSPR